MCKGASRNKLHKGEIKMKQKTVSLLLAVIMTLALAAPAFASGGFSDVPSSHWAYNDIMTCVLAVDGLYDDNLHCRYTKYI